MDLIEVKRDRESDSETESETDIHLKKIKLNEDEYNFVSYWLDYKKKVNGYTLYEVNKITPRFLNIIRMMKTDIVYNTKMDPSSYDSLIKYLEGRNELTNPNTFAYVLMNDDKNVCGFVCCQETELTGKMLNHFVYVSIAFLLEKLKIKLSKEQINNLVLAFIGIKQRANKAVMKDEIDFLNVHSYIRKGLMTSINYIDEKQLEQLSEILSRTEIDFDNEMLEPDSGVLLTFYIIHVDTDVYDGEFKQFYKNIISSIQNRVQLRRNSKSPEENYVITKIIPYNSNESDILQSNGWFENIVTVPEGMIKDYLYSWRTELKSSITIATKGLTLSELLEEKAYKEITTWTAKSKKMHLYSMEKRSEETLDYVMHTVLNSCKRSILHIGNSKQDYTDLVTLAYDEYKKFKSGDKSHDERILFVTEDKQKVVAFCFCRGAYEFLRDNYTDALVLAIDICTEKAGFKHNTRTNELHNFVRSIKTIQSKYIGSPRAFTSEEVTDKASVWFKAVDEMRKEISSNINFFIPLYQMDSKKLEHNYENLAVYLLRTSWGDENNNTRDNFTEWLTLICAEEKSSGMGIAKTIFRHLQHLALMGATKFSKKTAYVALIPDHELDPSPIYRKFGMESLYGIDIYDDIPTSMISKNLFETKLDV
jgi:hypothetical protein